MSTIKPPAQSPLDEFASAGLGYDLPTYAFETPPELLGKATQIYPVVIVGGGLGGLTLGVDLLQRGIPVVLVDEDHTVGVRGASSRGICYAQKSLEIFQRLGIYERIVAKGVQWHVGRTLDGESEVYSFDLRQTAAAGSSVQPPFINIQQYYIEWFLVERFLELAPSLPGSSLRWQTVVTACSQNNDTAKVQLSTPAGQYALSALWVVDASGVNSHIRNGFALPIHGVKGEDRWCISDVRFKTEPAAERWTWIRAPFNDQRAVWQHLMADGVWRLDYQMAPDTDMNEASRVEVVSERLKKQFGEGVDFELIWVGPYGYRSQMLDSFQHGRVLFVGDVAHVMSPFGARGGNSAIQDADNLGWKLAAVLEGVAASAFLNTYSDERVHAARENIEITRRTMRFLAAKPGVETTMRNAVLALAKTQAFARQYVNTGRMSIATSYPTSHGKPWRDGLSVPNLPLQRQGKQTNLVSLIHTLNAGVLLLGWGNAIAQLDTFLGQIPKQLKPVALGVANDGTASIADKDGVLSSHWGGIKEGVVLIRPDLYCAVANSSLQSSGQNDAASMVTDFVNMITKGLP